MKRKLLPIVSHEEVTEKTEKKEIDFETCPYCGAPMRIKLCINERLNASRGYYHSAAYDSVQFKCGFCGSTSPKVYLAADIIDIEKAKQYIVKNYIECDCDEDEEEENDDE